MNQTAKKTRITSCTVMRTFKRSHFTVNITTGEQKPGLVEVVTEPCSTPLFGNDTETGICSACRKGWTHPDNNFANDMERDRATGAA